MPRPFGSLLTALLLAGCTVAPSTTVTPTPAASASATSAPATSAPATSTPAVPSASTTPSIATQVIAITLKGGKVDPNGERVSLAKGTVLELVITSDRTDEVHVHGYDIEIPVTAGGTVTKDITLDQVGRFEVESHEPAFTILQLVVS